MINMLKVITKNFFHKPVTRLYPAYERPAFERSRGRILFEPKDCILCSICAKKCPSDAITVNRTSGEWTLNAFRCIICGECVNSCPKKCITMSNERRHSADIREVISCHKDISQPAAKSDHKKAAASNVSNEVAAAKE